MCVDPVTGLAIASTAVKIGGDLLDHTAQNKAHDANERAANDALKVQDHELSLQEVQQRIAGKQQIAQGDAQVLSATGDLQASAASRGIAGGMTMDLLAGDIQAQGSRYTASVDQNTEASVAQTENEKAAAYATAQSRINGVPGANPFATAMKIGGALVDYSSSRINMSPKGIK